MAAREAGTGPAIAAGGGGDENAAGGAPNSSAKPGGESSLAPNTVFRSSTALVRIDTQVLRSGRPVDGLTQTDFRVFDDGQPVQLAAFGQSREALEVILLFDVSGSMSRILVEMATVAEKCPGESPAGGSGGRAGVRAENAAAGGSDERPARRGAHDSGVAVRTRCRRGQQSQRRDSGNADWLAKSRPSPGGAR